MKIKFSYIMLIMALSISVVGSYFSVWGLSQLFAGASIAVIIMASILEVGKIVITTALHTYWDKLNTTLKIYLTLSVAILMIITSVGIYGFLSNAYQKTANKLEIHDGGVGILISKKEIFEKNVKDNEKIIDTKNKRIDQLSSVRTNQENRIDQTKGNRNKDKVRKDIQSSDKEIQKLSLEIDALNERNIILSDSVNKYNIKALEMKSGSEVAAEVGPLKYISELLEIPMANVVNYIILLLIIVFDPLAIALILATSRVFQLDGKQMPLEPKIDYSEPTEISNIVPISEPSLTTEQVIIAEEIIDKIDLPRIIEEVIEEKFENETVSEDVRQVIEEIIEEITEDVEEAIEEVIEEVIEEIETPQIEENVKKEPVGPITKINLEDIKEVKERNRNFSVDVPLPKRNNNIERFK